MFDVFGNFDSVEELNACAKGLLEEQDLEHLKVLAEENGIPDGIREVYEQHLSEELVDSVNAAIGKLQVELKEETDGMPAGEIVSYLSMRCFEKEILARAVRRKNRTLKECLQNIRKEAEKRVKERRGAQMVAMPDLVPYAASRLSSWIDPFADPLGDGHQTIQSLYAIGSGGAAGLGLGNSRQKHLFVPEPQNDFIFSIVCEELGFVGACGVILLFVLLLCRGITLAAHAPDRFGALLVVGFVVQVALQAVLNIAVVTNTIPNTGISLPFFSSGGTSLMMLLGEMGIVLSVSRGE